MTASVLVDTSYLISLVDQNRPNHDTAARYFRLMLDKQIPMYFSAIVAAEFGIKQPITILPLKKFRMLAFTVPHGREAARFANLVGQREIGTPRHVARDDLKLIAQASHETIPFILTEDLSTMTKYCERLKSADVCRTVCVTLAAGFDPSAFDENGQLGLPLSAE